ncbi:hypothetical protein LSAT2_016158 [Lamellibrachia satsuma]|nr:hypothetical protein LSAT2_016158 [Lamellibrachia satsuma]
MTLVGWLTACACSLPQLFVFHVNHVTTAGQFENMTVCESIWRERPIYERQTYLVYIGVVLFYVPCLLLWICYASIFYKIAKQANDGRPVPSTSGKVRPRRVMPGVFWRLVKTRQSATA